MIGFDTGAKVICDAHGAPKKVWSYYLLIEDNVIQDLNYLNNRYTAVFRLNALNVWRDEEVKRRLGWYYAVMRNEKPAKFLICKRIPSEIALEANEDELWSEHEKLSESFTEVYDRIVSNTLKLDELGIPKSSFLDLKIEILKRILRHCHLCEWKCGVDRFNGQKKGACRLNSITRVSTWFHHFGEEPPLVFTHGSGTIFFTGCTFRCVFCQNWDISQDPLNGVVVDAKRLALIMKNLREEGAHNINFVGGEPTMHLHTIIESMKYLEVNAPMLWNSNMYLTTESMKILKNVIDIWLPDFKYGNDKCAIRLSKIPRYFSTVARNHSFAQENGDIIIRHLVLPNHLECCTKPVLKWIAENCRRALVNVMGQYHPDHIVPSNPEKYGDISQRVGREINQALSYAKDLCILFEPVS